MHPFRFAVQASSAPSLEAWKALARKVEDLGYATLYVPDHLEAQWAPFLAMATAAEATSNLVVGPLVLDNDFRHPVILAKEIATLDLIANGRIEIGLGAGWMKSDYETCGIPMDKPSVRINRLEESISILEQLLVTGTATFRGEHYQVESAMCTPRPNAMPPLVIGGGGKKILSLAALRANIVSIIPSLAAGALGPQVAASAMAELFSERIEWVREASGDRFDDLELQCWTALCQVVPNRKETYAAIAGLFEVTPDQLEASPTVLVGSKEEIIETLLFRRERYGFSYVVVHEGEMEAFGSVVDKLNGT